MYLGSSGALGTLIRFTARDNVLAAGIGGDAFGPGNSAIAHYAPGGAFFANVLINSGNGSGYPAGNFFPSSMTAVGFTNAAGGDYTLTSSSTFKRAGTDGLDPGADLAAVLAATRNVIVP